MAKTQASYRPRGRRDDPGHRMQFIDHAVIEIENAIAERDEARREILESLHPDVRESHAAARGWDCFKEEP